MNEREKKTLLVVSEVITLVILTIVAYWGAMNLMFGAPARIMGVYVDYIWTSKIPFVLVSTLIVIWLATIKFWPLNIHIKIVFTLLLMVFSAAYIISYITAYVLRDFKW